MYTGSMKLFNKKKVVYELTPEQKAFLATCHELTLDELRLVNGGGGRNGMPSNIPVSASNSEKNESPANASAASGSSSYTGGSKGYNGMPTDVQEKMKNNSGTGGSSSSSTGVSNVSSTSSASSGSTNASGTYSHGTGSSSSSYSSTDSGAKESVSDSGESAETSHKTENKTTSSSGSSYSSGSSSKASSSTSSSSSGSTSSSGGTSSSGESKKPFPQPYAGAYEHGSYAEEQAVSSSFEENTTAPHQIEQSCVSKTKRRFSTFISRLFEKDGKKTTFTLGENISGTGPLISASSGAGVYIDPKNDSTFALACSLITNPVYCKLGLVLALLNIEELGLYGCVDSGTGNAFSITDLLKSSVSGSFALTVGEFSNIDDFKGAYKEVGGSISVNEVSAGIDSVFNMDSELIGTTASLGFNLGKIIKPLDVSTEMHVRTGVTFTIPLIKSREGDL